MAPNDAFTAAPITLKSREVQRGLALVLALLCAIGASLVFVTSVRAADTCEGYQQKVENLPEDGSATRNIVNSDGEVVGTITWNNDANPEFVSWQVADGYSLSVCVKGGDALNTGSGQSGTL